MADNTPTEQVQVETTKVIQGKVRYFGDNKWKTPALLARIDKGLRMFFYATSTSLVVSDLLSHRNLKIAVLILTIATAFTYFLDTVIGVEPEKPNQPYSAPKDQELQNK